MGGDAMKKKNLSTGIALMLTSALLTCTGQLCWKLSALLKCIWYFPALQ